MEIPLSPAAKRRPNVGSMPGRRLRRRPGIEPTLGLHHVFAGLPSESGSHLAWPLPSISGGGVPRSLPLPHFSLTPLLWGSEIEPSGGGPLSRGSGAARQMGRAGATRPQSFFGASAALPARLAGCLTAILLCSKNCST